MPGYGSIAALATYETINPTKLTEHEYYSEGQVAYVLAKGWGLHTPNRVFTSYGRILRMGDLREFHSDQSLRSIGLFRVIGIYDPAAGTVEGVVPNKKLPLWVAK